MGEPLRENGDFLGQGQFLNTIFLEARDRIAVEVPLYKELVLLAHFIAPT